MAGDFVEKTLITRLHSESVKVYGESASSPYTPTKMTPASTTTALLSITVGRTTVINGHVVTRWTSDRYEIDTWGRTTKTLTDAALIVAA